MWILFGCESNNLPAVFRSSLMSQVGISMISLDTSGKSAPVSLNAKVRCHMAMRLSSLTTLSPHLEPHDGYQVGDDEALDIVHLGDVQKNIYDVFLHAIITCANSCSIRT
jgi:hypothetical protein